MSSPRLTPLDGLRGLAALVVLLHHALLILPSFAMPYFWERLPKGMTGLAVSTPLHLFWAGPEAVYLFFVLSGLVLTMGAQRSGFDWGSYFPARIVRLMLPVIGAVLLGALVIALTPTARGRESDWMAMHGGVYDFGDMLKDATLVGGASNMITPLWSLQWELLFSLALPVFIAMMRRSQVAWQLPLMIVLSAVGTLNNVGALKFLPMFGVGVGLALVWDEIGARLERWLTTKLRVTLTVIIGGASAVLMVTSYWLLRPSVGREVAGWVSMPIILIGICALIVAAVFVRPIRAVFARREVRFLGTISFSLYLVHEPVVVFFARTVPSHPISIALGVIVSLVVAIGFWWIIEQPAHRLSRRVAASARREQPEEAASQLV